MAKTSCFRQFVHDVRDPKHIFASLRLLFIFAFWFGLSPFVLSSRNSPQLSATALGHLNMVGRIVFYIAAYTYSTVQKQGPLLIHLFVSDISGFTVSFQNFNNMFGIVSVLIIFIFKRRHLLNFVRTADTIEKLFFGVGVAINHKVCARWVNSVMLVIMSSTVVFIVLSRFVFLQKNGNNPEHAASICYYAPQITVSGFVVLHSAVFFKLRHYFRAINKVLKNLAQQGEVKTLSSGTKHRSLQCLDSFSMYTIVTKNPSDIIQESMEIHHLICEAASTANKYFTYQLLTIISIAFLIIVFDAYYVLETLLGKSKRETKFKTVEFVTFFSCQMILYLIAIISIVEGSNRAIKKSEKTGSIVHSLLNKAKNPEVKEKLQQFSMQLMHMKINFTAAGLFNIDRTLYFTISGALTTYLIILLQFTSNPPSSIGTSVSMNDSGIAGH